MRRRRSPGVRIRLQAAAAAAAGLVAALCCACATELPQAPSWITTLRLSVAQDTTRIGKVAADRDEFLRITDEHLMVDFTTRHGDGGRASVGDRLRVEVPAAAFSGRLGPIVLADFAEPAAWVPIEQALGVPAAAAVRLAEAGFSVVVPMQLPGFEEIHLREGVIEVRLANDLPVELRDVTVALVDGGGVQARSAPPVALPAGRDTLIELPLRSRALLPATHLWATGVSAASEGPVDLSEAGVTLAAASRGLRASRVRGLADGLPIRGQGSIAVPTEAFEVHRAEIRSWPVALSATNHLPVGLRVRVLLPDFADALGDTASFDLGTLPPGATATDTVSLAGLQYEPLETKRLRWQYQGVTSSTDPSVTLTQDDSISGTFRPLAAMQIRRLEGRVHRLQFDLPEVESILGFPPGLDNLEFRESFLVAHLRSAVGISGVLTLDIEGENRRSEHASLRAQVDVPAGDPEAPAAFTLAPITRDLTPFLEILPVTVRVRPRLVLGDGAVHRLADDHWAALDSVRMHTGSWFRIRSPTRIENGPDFRQLPKAASDFIEDDFVSGRILTRVTSSVPLAARVRILVASDAHRVYTDPDLVIPREGAYEVIAVSARGDTVAREREVTLTRAEARLLSAPAGVYSGTLIEFDATPEQIRLHESDNVVVTSLAWIDVEINR